MLNDYLKQPSDRPTYGWHMKCLDCQRFLKRTNNDDFSESDPEVSNADSHAALINTSDHQCLTQSVTVIL